MRTIAQLLFVIILYSFCSCQKKSEDHILLDRNPKEVEIFGENLISTGMYERDMAISPDGDEIIFTLSNFKQTRRCLVSIAKTKNGWGERQILNFSGQFNDIEPFFSPDGKKLLFVSNRPIFNDTTRSDYNIWYSEEERHGWGKPEPLSEVINTEADEFYPSMGKTGNLYFTATRNDGVGKEDIFMSRLKDGIYQNPIPLDSGVNSEVYEFNAFVNPDETLIIFGSYGRLDELGGGDLYYSNRNKDGHWSNAKNMGPMINSDKLDYCPFIDYPRGNFYFTSDRVLNEAVKYSKVDDFEKDAMGWQNGMGNIYRIGLDYLQLK